MKSSYIILLFAVAISLNACSQKLNIVKAKAFTKSSVTGTLQVDEYNRAKDPGVSTTHLIFVETKANKPQPEWDVVWINDRSYTVKPIEIKQTELRLGKIKNTDEDVVIRKNNGNQLWQLMLTSDKPVSTTGTQKTSKDAVVLTGKWNKKPFTYSIQKEQSIEMALPQ